MSHNNYVPLGSADPAQHNSTILDEVRSKLHESEARKSFLEAAAHRDELPIKVAVDPELINLEENFVDINSLSDAKRKLMRRSMLSADTIENMSEKEAVHSATKTSLMYQIFLFALLCVISSVTSVIDEWVLFDPVSKQRRVFCISTMNFLVSYFLSSVIFAAYSYMRYGMDQIYNLFNLKANLKYMPIAVGFGIQDPCSFYMIRVMGSSPWKVIGQSKIVFCALIGRIMFGTKLSNTQWLILICLTMAVCSSMGNDVAQIVNVPIKFILMSLSAIAGSTTVGLVCEKYLKTDRSPFVVQFCRTRICGFLVCLVLTLITAKYEGKLHLFPLGGYQTKYLISVANHSIMCYVTTLVVKRIDTLWKTLAGSVGLLGTYICTLIALPQLHIFNPLRFLILLNIATQILAFASSTRDELKMLQLYKEFYSHGASESKV